MTQIIFILSLIASVSIIVLSLGSAISKKFQFWPPPGARSWQYKTFWGLFRLMLFGVVTLSIIDFNGLPSSYFWWRVSLGSLLVVFGFSAAFYATFYLGWKNAHGEKEGLKIGGWYRWSRNPIYVVSILGMIGLGVAVDSMLVNSLLALWALLYIIAPFLEEPWLERQYGEEFMAYKARVPRFFGFVRNET